MIRYIISRTSILRKRRISNMGRTVMLKKHLALWVIGILIVSCLGGCGNQDGNAVIQDTVAEDIGQEVLDEEITKEEGTEAAEYVSSMAEVTTLGLPEDMLAYWMVLNSRQPFISTDEGYQEFYWDEYYWCLGSTVKQHQADYFMIVDMDGDGADEIVLECTPESVQVLHYEEGTVYSYQFVFRGMKRIHSNGIYEGSNGAANTSYHRLMELNKDSYIEETIAVMDSDYYEVEGVQATHEEFCAYVQNIENVELADVVEFTEDLLDTCLLGDLSEKELAVVKHAPQYEMSTSGTNAILGEEMAAYLAVMLSEDKFISVTDDNQEYYLNNYHLRKGNYDEDFQILYFSIVDMDQDGVYELVLTGGYDVTQIMHYEEGQVYSYQFDYDEIGAIAKDGVFLSRYGNCYGRIVSFDNEGCRLESIENHENINNDRIRYYYFSEISIQHSSYDLSSLNDGASLVLLNQARDDIQLYGITLGTASAMILYVDGEKVFLDHSFRNFYMEYPRLYCGDLDNDGREEIAISYRTATGNPGSWYGLSVCDYEDGWKVWDYDSWQQDVEAMIHCRWDEESRTMLFLDESDSVLTEIELPEWTENHPYTGKVDFGNNIHFNAEKMKLGVEPWILLENSLPYDPIVILFDVHYENGGFTIEVTDILDCKEYYNQGGIWN